MKEQKSYIERSDLKGATHLEVSVYYALGGSNYFSGGTTPRGYYLSVRPVTRGHNSVSFDLFSGYSKLLLETNRFSAKQFERAVALAAQHKEELIAAVVAKSKGEDKVEQSRRIHGQAG